MLADKRATLGADDRQIASQRVMEDLVVRAELEEPVGIGALLDRMVVGVVVHRQPATVEQAKLPASLQSIHGPGEKVDVAHVAARRQRAETG